MSEPDQGLLCETFENNFYLKECMQCHHKWIGDPLGTCPACSGREIGVVEHPAEGRLSVTDMEEV